ncbi:hypothetical protein ABPG72_001794 [Tetrahymena utriculariae]
MSRIYNLRKSNSKLCFQVDSYYDDDAESLKNSQDSEEFKLKDRSKSSMSNSKLQSCYLSDQSRRNYQTRSLQEDQRTSCQSTSFPSEDISNPSMISNNNRNITTENKKGKKSLKNQEKSMASLKQCLVKCLDSATSTFLEQSTFFSLPQINLPVNCSHLQKQSTPIQENNLISIFSSLSETHSPLYAASNKNQQIVTLALRQNQSVEYLQNCPNCYISETNSEVLKKLIGYKDISNPIQVKNSQIYPQNDQSNCLLKDASRSDKQANTQQKASTNSRKKNKIQSKYTQSQSTLQLAEKNKQSSFIIIENVKYQSKEDNSDNKQIHIHISHFLLKQLGWGIQEFVEQVSFSGLPEIACTKRYESLIHSLMSLLTQNTEQSSLCEKSVDTNDTSNFNSDKEILNTEISLITCKGEAIHSQSEVQMCENGSVLFKFTTIDEENQEKSKMSIKPINQKRYLSKTEIDYLATHFFKEESLGYDVKKVCKYRAI